MKLREYAEQGVILPASSVLKLYDELSVEEIVKWRSLSDAASIMGETPKKVRSYCLRWSRMTDPPIQVRKRGDKPKSPWELDEAGCFEWQRRKGKRHRK